MAFCGKCGASLSDGGNFCPKCGTSVAIDQRQVDTDVPYLSKKPGTWKKWLLGVAVVAIAIFMITSFTSTVDEPCGWCGDSPSVAYKKRDGSYSYVCKNCSKECVFCGNKATKHYENMLGMMVFVCNDCYKEMTGN